MNKSVEKWIIVICIAITIGAVGTSVYFGLSKKGIKNGEGYKDNNKDKDENEYEEYKIKHEFKEIYHFEYIDEENIIALLHKEKGDTLLKINLKSGKETVVYDDSSEIRSYSFVVSPDYYVLEKYDNDTRKSIFTIINKDDYSDISTKEYDDSEHVTVSSDLKIGSRDMHNGESLKIKSLTDEFKEITVKSFSGTEFAEIGEWSSDGRFLSYYQCVYECEGPSNEITFADINGPKKSVKVDSEYIDYSMWSDNLPYLIFESDHKLYVYDASNESFIYKNEEKDFTGRVRISFDNYVIYSTSSSEIASYFIYDFKQDITKELNFDFDWPFTYAMSKNYNKISFIQMDKNVIKTYDFQAFK